MLARPESLRVPDEIEALAGRVATAGGRLLLVGGWVRDACLGQTPRDLDLELYDLGAPLARQLLQDAGLETTRLVGRSFPVLLARGGEFGPLEVSFAEDAAAGERDFGARVAAQARRRDLTINAIALDPLSRESFDTHGGWGDLRARRLRAVDAARFGEDPLRALRVARFAASLDARPDGELRALCRAQNLESVSVERIFRELDELLTTERPSIGLRVLQETGVLRALPELAALDGVPQDPRWHPEGCVWTHTLMVVDEAAKLRTSDGERDQWLLWSALLHDLGKPDTTSVDEDAVRSHGHDERGADLARGLLERLRAPGRSVAAIEALVRHHLAPALLIGQGSTDRAFRRLARRLAAGGVDAALLEHVARADHLGRTTEEAKSRCFAAGDEFVARMQGLDTLEGPPAARVRGRDVVARGIEPGPEVGALLARCEQIADETGWRDGARILDRALREHRAADGA